MILALLIALNSLQIANCLSGASESRNCLQTYPLTLGGPAADVKSAKIYSFDMDGLSNIATAGYG